MDTLLKILLMILYLLLPLARVLNALLGRDRLRLHRSPGTASCWIERSPAPDSASYFSEDSAAEGRPRTSAAQPITHALRVLSRVYAPTHQRAEAIFTTAAHRDQDIPDEIYTLW